jgi:hypothetical protein
MTTARFSRILRLSILLVMAAVLTACDKKQETPERHPVSVMSAPAPQAAPAPSPPPVAVSAPQATQAPQATGPGKLANGDHRPAPKKAMPSHKAMANGTATSADSSRHSEEIKKSDLDSYSVNISANEQLKIPGPPGQMMVRIAHPEYLPQKEQGMSSVTVPLEATGESAKVTPFILAAIDVDPAVSQCGKLVPTGSDFRFKLIPRESGKFTVGATVELYASANCSGAPIPKSAKSVEVEIVVCKLCVVNDGLLKLAEHTWKAFLDFWDKLLILVFAVLLFLIRKKVFRWFGYKGEDKSP